MKCANCGATIGLEDRFCPYCGAANRLAVKHQMDMDRYEKSYESVRADVTEKSRRTASITAPVIIAAILLLMNVGAALFVHSSWDIGKSRINREMRTHLDDYRADFDQYLAEKDYGSYSGYYNTNSLYMLDDLDTIRPIERAAACYDRIFSETMNYNGFGYEYSYDGSAESLKRTAGSIAGQVVELYDLENSYSYNSEEYMTPENQDVIRTIRSDTEVLLKSWFSLTDEDCAALPSLSKNGVEELIIRRAENHEED